MVARRAAAGGVTTAAAARAAVAPEKNRGGREKEEREGRRVNRSLTQIDSKFCIETQKTVNIKVVGNSNSYNLRVEQNFIQAIGLKVILNFQKL